VSTEGTGPHHPPPRRAGRALVVDDRFRVLMIRGEDPADRARGGFWFTPGGGAEGDETSEDATRRELLEELGLEVGELGPVVMERESLFSIEEVWYRQHDTIRLVEAPPGFDPAAGREGRDRDELELTRITEMRWLTTDELRELVEPVYPQQLVALVDHLRRHGPPDPPWQEATGP
jgi:8-oxo-dGTP pyrophosphatase MutT (NUDIX family)